LDRWEAMALSQQMPPWYVFDVRAMFEGFYSEGFTATSVQIARLTKLLGHAPRSYEAFANEVVASWR